jgi:hypothetical protein
MKYFLSLCCIIKNERYLEEFIIYHHIVGVEHFYIYDNDSDNPIRNRLNNFYFQRLCTIIDFPGKFQQLPAYRDCIQKFGHETKWLAIIDGDEYIVPKQNIWSIRDLLTNNENAQAIGINWVMFGSSFNDNIQGGFLVDKYRYCENKQNPHIKSIVQPRYVTSIDNPHFVSVKNPSKNIDFKGNIINGPFNNNYTIDLIQINHYYYRSLEEFIQKQHRGYSDTYRYINDFDNHHNNSNDIIDNYLPDKYLLHIEYFYKRSGTSPKIYCALNRDVDFTQAVQHIFENAQRENRPLHINDKYPNFNKNYYKTNYPDVASMNDEDLDLHFINHGVEEGRIADRLIN